jgi:predicted nucleic acid-binding protein
MATWCRGAEPDDNQLLAMAMAVAGQADYLVTGDKRDLLSLGAVESTRIVSARTFVGILESGHR